jgi:hypothetical protein
MLRSDIQTCVLCDHMSKIHQNCFPEEALCFGTNYLQRHYPAFARTMLPERSIRLRPGKHDAFKSPRKYPAVIVSIYVMTSAVRVDFFSAKKCFSENPFRA